MFHIRSSRFYQQVILVFSILALALAAIAVAQSKKEPKSGKSKPTLSEAVVREGNRSASIKDADKFEFVKKGNQANVVFKASKEVLGSLGCGSCKAKECMLLIEGPRKARCVGCGENDNSCTLNPF